jgi:hypothetical protein
MPETQKLQTDRAAVRLFKGELRKRGRGLPQGMVYRHLSRTWRAGSHLVTNRAEPISKGR